MASLPPSSAASDAEIRYAVLMHLSFYSVVILPLATVFLVPGMWLARRERSPFLDATGRNIVNFHATVLLLLAMTAPWALLLARTAKASHSRPEALGAAVLAATAAILVLLAFLCPALGAIRANRGMIWRYPLTIPFISQKTGSAQG